jgi:alpha-1,3-glucosyltransferase
MLPSCLALFRGGKRYPPPSPSPDRAARRAEQQDLLLRGTACCACAFFLASFQVHEKSILMALAPASLLPPFGDWFGIVAAWTLWPLLVLDRLRTAYFCAMVFFAVALAWREPSARPGRTARRLSRLSYAAMVALHLLEGAVAPPPGMPDLFPVLWSVLGCALVSCAYLVLCRQLLLSADADRADAAAPVKPKLA